MGEHFKLNPSAEKVGQMMRQAVYMEDQVTLEHLMKQRADLEAKEESTGATPLHIAAIQCKPGTARWLIGQRANIAAQDAEGFSALTWACVKGHQAVVRLMLQSRADIEELTGEASSGKTPLALASERGHFACVEELLASRAAIEAPNRDGSTPLMCAAHHVETEVVAKLLERNSIVNRKDNEGWTALMYCVNATMQAALGGESAEKKVNIDGCLFKKTSTELLLLHKADVNAQTSEGLTPLIIAAGRDRPVAVKKLIESRAQVNLASSKGQTPLIMAAPQGEPELVRALIMNAAEVNAVNAKNECALSLSEKFGNKDVIELLKKAGAVAPKGKKKKKGGKK